MKKLIIISLMILSFTSCKEYRQGTPIIVKKEYLLFDKCKYTYEGWGRQDYFEDECDKYSVGDTLKTN